MPHVSRITATAGRRPWLRPVLIAVIAFAPLAGVGCQASQDRQRVPSTRHQPADVAVIDTVADRTLWRIQIPIDHELELDFHRPGADQDRISLSEMPPTHMTWELRLADDGPDDPQVTVDESSGEQRLSGNPVRMQVEYRQTQAVTRRGPYQPAQ